MEASQNVRYIDDKTVTAKTGEDIVELVKSEQLKALRNVGVYKKCLVFPCKFLRNIEESLTKKRPLTKLLKRLAKVISKYVSQRNYVLSKKSPKVGHMDSWNVLNLLLFNHSE